MKKVLSLMVFVAIFCLLFNSPVMGQINNFEMTPDGKVKANFKEFKNLKEYVNSDFFKKNGKRCKAFRHLIDNGGSIRDVYSEAASASDCTLSSTTINPEYNTGSYVIPIVFHILIDRNGSTGDLPDSRIASQVSILNQSYNGSGISFELAGITRTVNARYFSDRGNYQSDLGWDPNYYFNVYTNTAGGYLGYATFPQQSAGNADDGVVLLYEACGRNTAFAPYDGGKTLVHEAGHYFGLLHTFQGGCGDGYTAGDLLADTTMESTAHYDCVNVNSCGEADPIHNYMSYTDDGCMNTFTNEQENRMVCSIVNYRPNLYGGTTPGGGDVYVDAISMSKAKKGKNYTATAVITIKDDNGNPVSGATVNVSWSGQVSGSGSGTTGSNGQVSIKSGKASNGTFTVTVTDVSASGFTYNSSLNNVTSASI